MKRYFVLFWVTVLCFSARAQNTVTLVLKDKETKQPLNGATIEISNLKQSTVSDAFGKVIFTNVPDGQHYFEYRSIGYKTKRDTITLPLTLNQDKVILMDTAEEEELEEIVISTTRSSRTIANIPTRIEVIAGEELDEKANMKPGDIRMVLNESTGIQTQQTSATSANASIRIQGLDGRYTQILKDGFPLYSGAASGLGLLQTPPLDLKQVEVIKGSASTLYGGGAIAGLVNLISKTPKDERELNFHLNGTSAGGLDLNGFYGQKFGKAGLTVFASRNSNKAYAPAGIVFTAIPEFTRYSFNPKLFLYFNEKTSMNFGVNTSFETRTGGDMKFLKGEGNAENSFFERNSSDRISTQLAFKHKVGKNSELNFRNSLSYFDRKITIPEYVFSGQQYATFSEANYSTGNEKSEWVAGLNMWVDSFKEKKEPGVIRRDYSQLTLGAFVQNNLHVNRHLELETGLRGDYIADYGFALLPRISALFKVNKKFNSRLGGGLGYKAPTIFTEESERIHYRNVLPITSKRNGLERSFGLNWDLNYRTSLFNDNIAFSINQLFFYTYLNHPLNLEVAPTGGLLFMNAAGHMDSDGMETNVKLSYDDFKLFLGYSLTNTRYHSEGSSSQNPLTAMHRLNNVLMYEVEDKWKLGLEAYYYSKQKLNDNAIGKPYWITGFMAERLWEKFSIYINFENFTDTRQTRFDTIYTGNIASPEFRDIYAPLDGFVVNGGLKLKL